MVEERFFSSLEPALFLCGFGCGMCGGIVGGIVVMQRPISCKQLSRYCLKRSGEKKALAILLSTKSMFKGSAVIGCSAESLGFGSGTVLGGEEVGGRS